MGLPHTRRHPKSLRRSASPQPRAQSPTAVSSNLPKDLPVTAREVVILENYLGVLLDELFEDNPS